MVENRGWSALPFRLKGMFLLLVLWILASVLSLGILFEEGFPLFGFPVFGFYAVFVVAFINILCPLILLFGLYARMPWTIKFAWSYILLFILNSLVAFIMLRNTLGISAIVYPSLINALFLYMLHRSKAYFE